jgi:hypothetical protein
VSLTSRDFWRTDVSGNVQRGIFKYQAIGPKEKAEPAMQINLEPEVIEIMERMQAAGMKGSIEQIANRALRLNLD